MIFAIPPLMIRIPATLPFGIQIAPSIFGLAAALAIVVNRFVKPGFGLLYGMLAFRPVVGVRNRGCNKPRKRDH
jgi:hypothetical protein